MYLSPVYWVQTPHDTRIKHARSVWLLIHWFYAVKNVKAVFWRPNWLLFCTHIFNEKLYYVLLSFFSCI